jgi:general stress protein YciG
VSLVTASKKEISEYFAKFGRQGGEARAKNLTPERRKEIARQAAKASWVKRRKRKAKEKKDKQ